MKDKKIARLIKLEEKRQQETLDMIASENHASDDVLEANGSRLTDKYSEGYPGKRYYPGNKYIDEVEILAQKRALSLFKLDPNEWHVNVQPYSGSPANMEILLALALPGETISGLKLSSGGHLTHGYKVSVTGKIWKAEQYDIDPKTGLVDFEALEKIAEMVRPKVIISGFTAYPRVVDFKRFYEITKKVGAYHVVDMSHIAGLIAGCAYPSPFPYADVVMTTTHKTLRGPRGAVIFCKKELADKIDKAVFPGMQGGPHNNVTAAKAVCFWEASRPSFKKYALQVVKNARVLADELTILGFTLVGGGTDSHLILVDLRPLGIPGGEAEKSLEAVGIIANRNTVPGDASPFNPSGLRLGTPALTTRGMQETEMKEVAKMIHGAIAHKEVSKIKKEVLALAKKFPIS
ncbi:serine hydroxymethyltransferase [Candidatus Giovannonibacteria bacterium RIFCSPHIGHO2_02_43_13]|uniref:Serine hydroxymethyltransferase n=1 Tax=Candidatus Giovannonibacteria bacterium RIFCSPHIGHO2_02_43_13 TaxID=1798330 RepID=A0A1F5WQ39_9BACT|nr:MAG: serine hydroxymethyltransferase [Candidatus Giovannonibacteria bacterium RIFCSPHIGHO2_12_FULL_44_42]OGF77740.1 MAG: serine hydroxymethyltransferase [Candidatus Giovannonibacteria bacterium RIFCSPHIGHO2_02_43_13]OGF90219.1 MAG: serine hydroxymethyltransferase [Candidatus Giovannonibacteria bacterium RIFCSPLOWO2_02_FULL_43_54]OGF96736.1 MAG: serine hydroxymethyltransferase [Candidatus Giovannonibacteria bacterium RIFCSPLOWO2_12_FULL_44_32]